MKISAVKPVVELHGASVEAQSAGPGTGSEFVVRLPLVDARVASQQSDPATDTATAKARRRRVLIVEDNIDSAESLRMLLELDGHDARCVYDGVAALELVPSFEPDVAILDLGLPQMNGFELAQRLRDLPQTRQSLLVALTGYGQSEDKRRTEAAGFDHHLVKPVDPEQLSALVGSSPMRDIR